jgi:hypothetical protein
VLPSFARELGDGRGCHKAKSGSDRRLRHCACGRDASHHPWLTSAGIMLDLLEPQHRSPGFEVGAVVTNFGVEPASRLRLNREPETKPDKVPSDFPIPRTSPMRRLVHRLDGLALVSGGAAIRGPREVGLRLGQFAGRGTAHQPIPSSVRRRFTSVRSQTETVPS